MFKLRGMQSTRLLTVVLIAMDGFITAMLKLCLGLHLSQGAKGCERQVVWTFMPDAQGSSAFSDWIFPKEDSPFVYSAAPEVIVYRFMAHTGET